MHQFKYYQSTAKRTTKSHEWQCGREIVKSSRLVRFAIAFINLIFKMHRNSKKEPGIFESIVSALSGEPVAALPILIPSKSELRAVTETGSFGVTHPSTLFSQIYLNILKSVEDDASNTQLGPITGATGAVPLTIISTVPDIADHYYDLIIEASFEVIIFSNFWKSSYAARRIGDALRTLSEKIGRIQRPRVAAKIMFDRGSVKHVLYPRVAIAEAEWVSLGLPPSQDIPNVDLEVINYHNFPIGTLHSKFMVIDKRVAVLNSCNIQDNSNLEMMCQFEGPIVHEIWDHALATWGLPGSTKSSRENRNSNALGSAEGSNAGEAAQAAFSSPSDPLPRRSIADVTKALNRAVGSPLPQDITEDDISFAPFRSHARLTTKDIPMVLAPRVPYPSRFFSSLVTD
ncbi:hypothetical protein TWF481_003610 [Arthrobotrys musiformis]|uniref:PLD phosphodiesterase domain-containing protein n=1 Tax=Arthrobotrys musiformis TaxID=47236 RepID=A0AAV9WIE0_9PEZI